LSEKELWNLGYLASQYVDTFKLLGPSHSLWFEMASIFQERTNELVASQYKTSLALNKHDEKFFLLLVSLLRH